jgi:hypothetical protein
MIQEVRSKSETRLGMPVLQNVQQWCGFLKYQLLWVLALVEQYTACHDRLYDDG